VISAVLNAMTIIGIPFAIQHLKLAGCALAPVGKTVASKEVAADARRRNANVASGGTTIESLLVRCVHTCTYPRQGLSAELRT
jgi:hypothetical protein